MTPSASGKMKKRVLAAGIGCALALLASHASAQTAPQPPAAFTPPDGCDPAIADYLRTASEKGIQSEIARGQFPFSQPQSVTALSCLDNLLNQNFNLMGGFPSLDNILSQIMNKVCSAAQSLWGQSGGRQLYQLNSSLNDLTNPVLNIPGLGTVQNERVPIVGPQNNGSDGISGKTVAPANAGGGGALDAIKKVFGRN